MSRQNLPMPASTADLATTWAFLEDGVDHIMTQLQSGVSFSKVLVTSLSLNTKLMCLCIVYVTIYCCIQLLYIVSYESLIA